MVQIFEALAFNNGALVVPVVFVDVVICVVVTCPAKAVHYFSV